MKKLVKVEEIEGEGLLALMGQRVTLYCAVYIYSGKLIGVNDDCVLLEDPEIVYDTGKHETTKWADASSMPHEHWYVMKGAIESFGVFK
jgi:hypothetical protein